MFRDREGTTSGGNTIRQQMPGQLRILFLATSRNFGAAFTLSGKGYVAGGYECWQYDDANDTWTQMAFFDNRVGGSAFVIGNKAFYAAGRHEPPPNNFLQEDLWEFDPTK